LVPARCGSCLFVRVARRRPGARIHANLTAGALDLTKAQGLAENRGVSFMGDTKGGAFDVPAFSVKRRNFGR
jgi:hypothetical protein